MTEEELQEALIGALIGQPVVRDHYTLPITPRDAHLLAAPLLPIVRAYAAEELRAAAEELHVTRFNADRNPKTRYPEGAPKAVDSFYAGIVRARIRLRARADALTASEGAS